METRTLRPFSHPSRSLAAAVVVIMLMPLVLGLYTQHSQRSSLGAAMTALAAADKAAELAAAGAPTAAGEDAQRLGRLIDDLTADPAVDRATRLDIQRRWGRVETGLAVPGPGAERESTARLGELAAELRRLSSAIHTETEAEAERSANAIAAVIVFSVAALLTAAWYTWRRVSTPLAGLSRWVDVVARTGHCDLPPPTPDLGPLEEDLERLAEITNGRLSAYRSLLDGMGLSVFVIDGSGKVVFANARAVKDFGAVEGRLPLYAHLPPEDGPMIEESITRLLTGADGEWEDGFTAKTTLHGVDGPRAAELTASPISTGEGPPERVIVAARITTEADRLRAELEDTREEARRNAAVLKEKIRDLEEFTLLAVRRELKMKEIREMLDSSRSGDPGNGGKGRMA